MNVYHFVTTPLDPDVLATSFEHQTNWHVLTGAACSGKTTLIDGLAALGFSVIRESARPYFETELAKGRTLAEIRSDLAAVQRGILPIQLRLEQAAQPAATVFLDRAFPDCLTFYRVCGLDPNEILPECFHYRYASVFILDRLPFRRCDTLGPEDDTASNFLDEWLVRDYSSLGYDVLRAPVLPPDERLAFVLGRIPERI